jgi:PAS domain S-box-containing protein
LEEIVVNEIFYKQLIEESPTGYAYHKIICDKDGIPCDYEFIEINATFEKFTGLKGTDILGKRVSEVIPGIKTSGFDWIKFYGEVALNGGEKEFEQFSEYHKCWFKGKVYSPQKNFFATYLTDMFMKKDRSVSLDTENNDNTQHKIMESTLKKNEEEYRVIFDNDGNLQAVFNTANIGISVINKQGKYVMFNNWWLESTGYNREEMLNVSYIDLTYPEDKEKCKKYFKKILEGEADQNRLEKRCVRKDNTYFWADISVSVIKDENNIIISVIEMVIDITKRKLVEEALRESEREIIEAKKKAEASNIAKSEFLANVSHEIRTPMNAIIGFTGLVSKTDMTPKQKSYISKVESSAKSLLGIIDDILDFSKIDSGKLEMEATNFCLEDVINNIVSGISVKAAEKDIELLFSIAQDVPADLIGDAMRLSQVLNNFVNNAVKFTETGHVLIKVELVSKDSEKCRIKFAVIDTGIGMTKEHMSKLFLPFSQADSSITRKFGGTGLGLTISKQLVEMMNGEIFVESEFGVGSSFVFVAEFLRQSMKKNNIEMNGETVGYLKDSEFFEGINGIKVLLVEDSIFNQEIARELLSSAGVFVDIVNNGQKAVEAVSKENYDMVLMDIQMPIMGGYEASKLIRNDEKNKALPIIAMTANSMQGAKEECKVSGMNDYVSKPVDPDNLFAIMRKWINPVIGSKSIESQKKNNISRENKTNEDFPQKLQGINVESGLKRLNGNTKLYKELLIAFAKEYASFDQELRISMEKNEKDIVLSLLHKLKGISGNISAYEIQNCVEELENVVLKDDKEQTYNLVNMLSMAIHSYENAVKEISKTEETVVPNSEKELNVKEVEKKMQELELYIWEDNVDAKKALEELKKYIYGSRFREEMQALSESIGSFDFEAAKEPLQKIAKELNLNMRGK